jgi:uncharacterized protein DUF4038/collagenase-like protein with putative collagen-binding domain
MKLTVSDNKRFLVRRDGKPFFWLGDTAWELVHRLSRDEIRFYLDNRLAKGFTVVQTVCLAELNGIAQPNAEGETALIDGDISRPNDRYFDLVEFAIDQAAQRGMYIGLLPTWGSHAITREWTHPFLPRHPLFEPGSGAHAREYGHYLGKRFGEKDNLVWVLGGDTLPSMTGVRTWMKMAQGIAEGATGGEHYDQLVMTYHPRGQATSSAYWHHEPWLTFNMLQTGHDPDYDVAAKVRGDYDLPATKPVINGEPMYERLPAGCRVTNDKLTDRHVRYAAYASVFAGAFGHTYGANEIWMMWEPSQASCTPSTGTSLLRADTPWKQALDYPGAAHMGHMRALIESRPQLTRVPDQSILGEGPGRYVATRDADWTYAMIYFPGEAQRRLDLSGFGDKHTVATWFDPRTRRTQPAQAHNDTWWIPPADGDWVLIIDDVDAGYPRKIEPGWA